MSGNSNQKKRGLITGHSRCSTAVVAFKSPTFFPVKTNMKPRNQQIRIKTGQWNKPYRDSRSGVVFSSLGDSDVTQNPIPLSDTIKQFYTCINEKNSIQLSKFIAADCFFDDCSFPKPFQGKKEVMEFFDQLIVSMGQNVEFNIGIVCEGADSMAGVTWHLEWSKKQIPFTRGCSFYQCSMEGTTPVIKKALVVIESPLKPGGPVLILLKTVTSLFDSFPRVAEWFLRSPHVVLQVILRIYNAFLWPFIRPVLAWYINLAKFMARLLSYTVKILLFISKFLNY